MDNYQNKPILYTLDDPSYSEFSNFYPSPIEVDDREYPTVEHYYQSKKFQGSYYEQEIIKAPDALTAFHLGQTRVHTYRGNWKHVKEEVMYAGLKAKFNKHESMRQKLLSTGHRQIIEHFQFDTYWSNGGGDGKGLNKMGQLLMRLRGDLTC